MHELIIDLFAGGGGVSEGIRRALGRSPDIAINHDKEAIAMHAANHPDCRHYPYDVFDKKTHPCRVTRGCPVGYLHLSPDCTHFSNAKGDKPVSRHIRGLAWIAVKWAKAVNPRVITLENVPEFRDWGPTMKVKIRDKKTGRFKTVEKPDPKKKGMTFQLWANQLRGLGYNVQFRVISAADYGTPTIRKRLYMIARCDGQPIVWPEPTHAAEPGLFGLKRHRAAGECIDFNLPCPSIFERKKPLAENTMRRIARGIEKFVLNTANPFIVGIDHQSSQSAQWPITEPLRTITQENRFALVAPYLTKYHGGEAGEGRGQRLDKPLLVQDTQNRFRLVAAHLVRHFGKSVGGSLDEPMGTVMPGGMGKTGVVSTFLTKFYGTNIGSDMRQPMPTITGQGQHIGEVRAFLTQYNGTSIGQSLNYPMNTVTGRDRFGLVTVYGEKYQIYDIGLRMLSPRELARAQGFYDSYILTGTKTSQVARIGNSVPPPPIEALVKANVKIKELEESKVG